MSRMEEEGGCMCVVDGCFTKKNKKNMLCYDYVNKGSKKIIKYYFAQPIRSFYFL